MGLENLKPSEGSLQHGCIVGRGHGTGKGKTCGRGQKGQRSRTGDRARLGFSGGQTPLFKRFAKRGFTHVFKVEYATVNVGNLSGFKKGTVVDEALLREVGLINKEYSGVKLLGDGEVKVALTVKVNKVSASAKAKIEAAGGTVEVI